LDAWQTGRRHPLPHGWEGHGPQKLIWVRRIGQQPDGGMQAKAPWEKLDKAWISGFGCMVAMEANGKLHDWRHKNGFNFNISMTAYKNPEAK
jgi:hypothetical protein